MTAHNPNFPWLSYYGHYEFFEMRMFEHSKVESLEKINIGLYKITIKSGKTLRVFICECYAYGMAEFVETTEKYGKVDAVIISSNWCGYTLDVKYNCMHKEIGIFDIGGFMGAINKVRFWEHMTDFEKEKLEASK